MHNVDISHFSDVLCVWAWVAQVRMRELERQFDGAVSFDYRYFSVFGDVHGKLDAHWRERGGRAAYAEHVRTVAARFEHVELHRDVWTRVVPRSSMPAHLVLCAARLLARADGAGAAGGAALRAFDNAVREAFFCAAADIADIDMLLALAARQGFERPRLAALLDCGAAHAELTRDLQGAAAEHVRASPTLLFNEGRQVLTGNVGYRVLEANVRELLHHPEGQQSWC
ncbi:MAG: DsbA family protein [Gammaproteobacteria bacterium]